MAEQSEKSKLNWLRASVLGANDGIVSTAGLVVGVAGATKDLTIIATAGVAGLIAGALSMAAGEYVSVSTQKDAEKNYIKREKHELKTNPDVALAELTQHYVDQGLSKKSAVKVAQELTDHDALSAHLHAEFGMSEDDLTNPWHAAIASAVSFTIGGLIPFLAITIPPENIRVPITFASVLVALFIAGYVSAVLSDAGKPKAIRRVVLGGVFAMIATYAIGYVFGVNIV